MTDPTPPSDSDMLRVSQRPANLVPFFSRALASFQSSPSTFQVICTIPPPRHDGSSNCEPKSIPPASRPHSLIVLDSSFNPPTIAHLRMATSAIHDTHRLQPKTEPSALRLLLLLSINNADKAPKPAAFDQRLAMMWAFARDIQQAQQTADTRTGSELSIDVALSTRPYFHEKSAAIDESTFYKGEQQQQEEARTMEQTILAGYDTLIRIFNPKYYGPPSEDGVPGIRRALDPFFARARLRVTMRTDDEWGDKQEQVRYLDSLLNSEKGGLLAEIGGRREWASRVELVEGKKQGEFAVSSTYAREAARDQAWQRLGRMVPLEVEGLVREEGLYRNA